MALGLWASAHADEAASPGSVQTVEAFFEAYDEADTDRLSALLTEDAEMFVQSPDGFVLYRNGRDDVLAYLAEVSTPQSPEITRDFSPAGNVVVFLGGTDFLPPKEEKAGRRLVKLTLREQKVSVILSMSLDRAERKRASLQKWMPR